MSEEETQDKGPTKKEQREQLYADVKGVIEAAGQAGVTAPAIAEKLGLLTGDAEKDKDVLHEMRAVARNVCKKEGWSRINREGRQKLYQAIPEEEAMAQKAEEDAAREEEKARKREERKAAKEAEEADDDDDDDDGDDGDDEDYEDDDE